MPRLVAEHLNALWPAAVTGLEAWSSRWSVEPTPRHAHDDWQISLTRSGAGTVDRRQSQETCRAGTIVIVPPGETHTLAPAEPASSPGGESAPWTFDTLFVPAHTLRGFSIEAPESSKPPLAALFTRLHRSIVDRGDELEQHEHLQEFGDHLQKAFGRPESLAPMPPPPSSALRRARDFLEARPTAGVTLAELSAIAGLGPFPLVRAFRREYGLPPYAYHLQVRVNRARVLLREGMPVAEVAARTGFADQAHLTRHFRRLVGMTPGGYRDGGTARDLSASRGRRAGTSR